MALVMYHATTPEAARLILAEGFRAFDYSLGNIMGVWLSRVPVDQNEGAKGITTLEVVLDLTDAELAEYAVWEDEHQDPATGEWVKEEGFEPYEWVMPAEVVNRGRVRLLSDAEAWELRRPAPRPA